MNTFATKSTSCCVTGISKNRITREEVITLRNISVAKKSWTYKVQKAFHTCCDAIVIAMATPVKKAVPVNSMCKFYGHIIEGPWQGHLPKCRDCGSEIQSPDQLRKAFLKH